MSKRDFITDVVIANSSPDELVNLALAYMEETNQDDTREWATLFVVSDLLQTSDIEDNALEISSEEVGASVDMTFGEFVSLYAASVLLDDQSRRLDMLGRITASMPQLITNINDASFLLAMVEAAGFEPGAGEEGGEDEFQHEEKLEWGEKEAPNGSHLRLVPKPGEIR